MNLTRDRLLVRLDPKGERTSSGRIIIPDEARHGSTTGTVLDIGPDQFMLKRGDRIVFGRYAGIPVYGRHAQDEQVIMDGHEVLAIFIDEDQITNRLTVAYCLENLLASQLEEGEITYVHYSHESKTLYVTYDRAKPEGEVNG